MNDYAVSNNGVIALDRSDAIGEIELGDAASSGFVKLYGLPGAVAAKVHGTGVQARGRGAGK